MQNSLRAEKKPWIVLDFDVQNKNTYQVGFGRHQHVLRGSLSFESSHLGVLIVNSKAKTLQFLSQLGFTVPKQATVQTSKQACLAAQKIGYPVVVKAEIGTRGTHVYSNLAGPEEIIGAFDMIRNDPQIGNGNAILLEKFIHGDVYRFEVVKGEFFDAYQMIPARVVGDGIHTIKELVDIENQNPARKPASDPTASYINLQLNSAEIFVLKKQGKSVKSIPERGQEVLLCSNSNWSKGGTYKRASHRVHEDNKRLVERLARALKIDFIGIDLITFDIEKSFLENNLTIIEINHAPDMGSYYDVEEQRFIDISKRMIERIAPNTEYGDVPIIVFKASEFSDESALLFADAFDHIGYDSGLINQQGLTVNGQLWNKPERINYTNPSLQLLRNEAVGSVIINHSLETLADFGLGDGGCDIAVVLNCKNKSVETRAWPQGVSTQKLDNFLLVSARLACIVFVDSADGIEFCRQANSEKTVALFTRKLQGKKTLIKLNVNCIELLTQNDEGILLSITYENCNYEKWLAIGKIHNPVPWLAIAATFLALGIEIKELEKISLTQ
jgi:cyanophycin synthetase